MPGFFFCVGLKCRGRNENQLAGRHYLSILLQECIDTERENRPSPIIQSGLHSSFSSLLLFHFQHRNSCQSQLMFSVKQNDSRRGDDDDDDVS